MSTIKVSPISPPMILGEGPHWIEKDKSLIFVDYSSGNVNRLFTETERHQVLHLDGSSSNIGPSVIIPVESCEEKFVIGFGLDLVVVEWSEDDLDSKVSKPVSLCTFDQNYPQNGLNDAKVDPSGRLWAGTKGYEENLQVQPKRGSLYRIDKELQTTQMVEEVTLSNGLTWSNDSRIFFFIDSMAYSVDAFDYSDTEGEISNRRVVFDYKNANLTPDIPDGMTIDLNGNLWVACFSGGKVLCIDPQVGKVLRHVDIPSRHTTSCAFGGPDYSTLYVTSATRGMTLDELKANPDSGKTFAVTGLGVKGSPHRNFHVNLELLNNKSKTL